jgi:hypothetical protein
MYTVFQTTTAFVMRLRLLRRRTQEADGAELKRETKPIVRSPLVARERQLRLVSLK